ncbi:MAG TPA: hypothetical protein VKQ27_13355 [Acetobacteraceae bacterium]|nr:hypothetical protein [Acetobacteraceae bacterium]
MTHESRRSEPSASHEKRRQGTEQRLRAALARLNSGTPIHPSLQGCAYQMTISVLAREAGVGRNTIYTNHRSILDELSGANRRTTLPSRPAPTQKTTELTALIEQLRKQKRQLATENASLLKRAIDAEKAVDRLRKHNAKIVRELAATRQPIALAGGQT